MTHEPQTFQSPKYNLSTKRQKQRVIKRWVIAIGCPHCDMGFAGMPALELKSKSVEILKAIFQDYSIQI